MIILSCLLVSWLITIEVNGYLQHWFVPINTEIGICIGSPALEIAKARASDQGVLVTMNSGSAKFSLDSSNGQKLKNIPINQPLLLKPYETHAAPSGHTLFLHELNTLETEWVIGLSGIETALRLHGVEIGCARGHKNREIEVYLHPSQTGNTLFAVGRQRRGYFPVQPGGWEKVGKPGWWDVMRGKVILRQIFLEGIIDLTSLEHRLAGIAPLSTSRQHSQESLSEHERFYTPAASEDFNFEGDSRGNYQNGSQQGGLTDLDDLSEEESVASYLRRLGTIEPR